MKLKLKPKTERQYQKNAKNKQQPHSENARNQVIAIKANEYNADDFVCTDYDEFCCCNISPKGTAKRPHITHSSSVWQEEEGELKRD